MRVWLPGEPRLASRLVPQHGQTCRRDHAGDEEHSPHGLGHAHRPEVLAHGDGRGRRAATGQAVREAGVRASREAQGRAWRAWGCAPREEAMFVVHSALLYVACGTGVVLGTLSISDSMESIIKEFQGRTVILKFCDQTLPELQVFVSQREDYRTPLWLHTFGSVI